MSLHMLQVHGALHLHKYYDASIGLGLAKQLLESTTFSADSAKLLQSVQAFLVPYTPGLDRIYFLFLQAYKLAEIDTNFSLFWGVKFLQMEQKLSSV